MKESDKLRLIDYLQHILQAIQRIEHYTEDLTDVALDDVREDSGFKVQGLRFNV